MYAKPLQIKRKDVVLEVMNKYSDGNNFYDIGCAEGLFCNLALSFGSVSAKGIDAVEAIINKAKSQFPNCEFEIGNCLNLNEQTKYGLILCSEVLQHIVDYKKVLKEISKILDKNGVFILTTPNLSQENNHIFANLDLDSSPKELLKEIGGASYGRQNAIWKFNTMLLCKEIEDKYLTKLK